MPALVAALPYIAAGAAVAGAGVGAYSSYESGQQEAALARYNQAQQNAQNQYQLSATAAKSLAERDENKKILAQQTAAFAASGVVTDTGSPLTVQSQQASLLERRALNTDYEGDMAYFTGQSEVTQDEYTAQAATEAGNLGAAATLLRGAGSAAGAIYGTGGGGGGGGNMLF
jgi:hypothetical protein